MPCDPGTLYSLIGEIRGAFNDLKTYSDTQNEDLQITAAMRAVIEHVESHGAQTVPVIAKAKNVTRQHIQQLADVLVADGLARFEDNPAHKRSKLLALTQKGLDAFEKILARETNTLDALARHFSQAEVSEAAATVRRLRRTIAELPQTGGGA